LSPVTCSKKDGEKMTRLNVGANALDVSPEYDGEKLHLRKSEIQKLEIGWEMPDWTRNSPLRQTSKGERIVQRGDLARRLSELKSLVSHTPEWVLNSPLRKKKTLAAPQTKQGSLVGAMPFD
jgi:hypothetical protein